MSETTVEPLDAAPVRAQHALAARRLEYFTLGWNSLEALAALLAGIFAGSIALVGFGVDSLIESFSSVILLWRFQQHEGDERRERIALKLVGGSFLLLAAYVAIDAAKSLLAHEPPHESVAGIVIAAAALVVMPLLGRAKRRVATRLDSRALHADSRQTDLCAYLSAILLVGLALNAVFGWWWADPLAALIMLPIVVREGVEALRGKSCGLCHPEI